MVQVNNETLERLLGEFQLQEKELSKPLEQLDKTQHAYLKDLRINLNNALSYSNLTRQESLLLGLATAINDKNTSLIESFTTLAYKEGIPDGQVAEVYACVSIMNVNNVFYRFRHFTQKDYYNQTPAGIKMNVMINPVLGKEFFELMSLALSALNGCELCVNAHEQSVIKHGGTEPRIYDAVRLVSVVKGFCMLVS